MQSARQCEQTRHRWPLLKGILFAFLWYFSIWAGFLYVCCPLWIFILLWPKLFLPVMSAAFSVWEMYPVALMNLIFGTRFRITGDLIQANEISLLLANHRTRVDWNFLWGLMYYASQPRNHRMKITLKAPLRNVPSLGWVMQIANCVYLSRKWEKDESIMRRQLKFFRDTKVIYQMLFFPEGTDLTEHNLRRSNEFAKKHNLKSFTRVLHPKTTGFVFLVDTMRSEQSNLTAVYDLTLAYSDFLPQTEMDIVRGNFPKLVNFHITRYPIDSLPTDKANLQSWIQERWHEKEERLETFHQERTFAGAGFTSSMETSLYLAFVVWTTLVLFMFYLFIASTFFFWWTVVHVLLFVLVSYASLGYQTICVAVHEFWTKKEKIL